MIKRKMEDGLSGLLGLLAQNLVIPLCLENLHVKHVKELALIHYHPSEVNPAEVLKMMLNYATKLSYVVSLN